MEFSKEDVEQCDDLYHKINVVCDKSPKYVAIMGLCMMLYNIMKDENPKTFVKMISNIILTLHKSKKTPNPFIKSMN